MKFKPMLASDADLDSLKFPLIASPKLDGVRATFQNGTLLTRSLKPIPNRAVNELFRSEHALDGELIVGHAYSPTVFRDTMKVVMSHDAPIDGLTFRVFDLVTIGPFKERFTRACDLCDYERITPVPHTTVDCMEELMKMERDYLAVGYEGLMLRDIHGPYKHGRATTREGTLLKLKRHNTAEAIVIGFEEQLHNANELKTDALGYAERSSHKANMVPLGTLGALIVKDVNTLIQFNVGTGFTAEERQTIWDNRPAYEGKVLTYESLLIGVKEKPRHPVFKGWRAAEDM